jgi:hypothetical protein
VPDLIPSPGQAVRGVPGVRVHAPHLTIGKSQAGGQQALRAAAESVGPRLPIEATAAEVILMAGPRPGTPDTPAGQWRTIAAFPLG